MRRLRRFLLRPILIFLAGLVAACGDDPAAPVDTSPPTFGRMMGSIGGNEYGGDLAVMSTGLRVVVGQFVGVMHIGTGTDSLEAGTSYDAFAVAFRDDGSVAWKRAIGGDGIEAAFAVARDESDNLFIGGSYRGATTIAGNNLSEGGLDDALVAKLAPDGTPMWAIGGGSSDFDYVRDLVTTPSGDAVVCGVAGLSMVLGGKLVGEASSAAGFVERVSSLGGGVWAATATGTGTSECEGIARAGDGSFFVCGHYIGSNVTVALSVMPNDGGRDGFVAHFSDVGDGLGAYQVGGTGSVQLRSIITMGDGYVAVGYMTGSNDFDVLTPAGNVTGLGNNDVVVARWSQPGVLQWVKQFGSAQDEAAWRVARFGDHILISGWFSGSITFGSRTLTTNGLQDIFMAELDGNGDPVWAGALGSASDDYPSGVVGTGESALVIGMVQGDTHFPDGKTRSGFGNSDVCIFQR